jgi:hypothetical protein
VKTATFSCSLKDVVLAWLVVPRKKPSHSDLVKALAPMFEDDHAAAEKGIDDTLQKLRADGYTDRGNARRSKKPPLKLSEKGRRAALNFLSVTEFPPEEDWTWTKKVLWLKSVGLPITPTYLKKAGAAEWKAAYMLTLAYRIDLREELTPTRVVDALFWRALAQKTPEGSQGAVIAESVLHVVPTPPDSVEEQSVSEPAEPEPPETPVDLETFARRVNEAALATPTGRWLDDKVFISHVYEELKRRHQAEGRTPEEFKRQLLQAHHARLVRLNRADFVGALPQGDVLSSKTDDGEHTFHFVRIDHLGQVDVSGARGMGRTR